MSTTANNSISAQPLTAAQILGLFNSMTPDKQAQFICTVVTPGSTYHDEDAVSQPGSVDLKDGAHEGPSASSPAAHEVLPEEALMTSPTPPEAPTEEAPMIFAPSAPEVPAEEGTMSSEY